MIAFDFNNEALGDVKCDVTYLDHELKFGLRNSINRDGIVIYKDKINYEKRYQLFSEALNDFYIVSNGDCCAVEIRRIFEVCFEHSWKLIKLLLESHGESFDKNVAPSVVIAVACRRDIIEDSLIWRELLDSYNDCGDVKTEYLKMFRDLKCQVDTISVENR